MIFNFIIESYLKHLLFYFQTFLHTLENACLSVIVTCRNGATGNIPSFDITDYKANKFYLRANTGNVSTFITAIGY